MLVHYSPTRELREKGKLKRAKLTTIPNLSLPLLQCSGQGIRHAAPSSSWGDACGRQPAAVGARVRAAPGPTYCRSAAVPDLAPVHLLQRPDAARLLDIAQHRRAATCGLRQRRGRRARRVT